MTRTAFRPEIHGFHFANYFVNKLIHVPWPFDKDVETYGRCGGMAFASLDYFYAGEPVPTHVSADFAPLKVPPDGHPLADYIYQRLLDSYLPNVLTFAAWTQAPDHPVFLRGDGVPRMTRQEQAPELVKALDGGNPAPLGLVFAGPDDMALTGIGTNHSVVAYGYDREADGTLRVYIYDNNQPDQEVLLTLDMNKVEAYAQFSGKPCRGFFVQAYKRVPPRYVDLVVDRSLALSQRAAACGSPLTATYRVANMGASPAHLGQLALRVLGPDGRELPAAFAGDGNPATLGPGESRELASTAAAFGEAPGTYTVEAAYFTAQGSCLSLPPAGRGIDARGLVDVHVTMPGVSMAARLRSMSTAVDPPRILLSRHLTLCVTALDSQLGSPVEGARVWITPATGGAAQEVGAAGAALRYIFRRARNAAGGWVYPSGFVRAPGYADAAIDFGFPSG